MGLGIQLAWFWYGFGIDEQRFWYETIWGLVICLRKLLLFGGNLGGVGRGFGGFLLGASY